MSDMDELESYLAAHLEHPLESPGRFTLDPKRQQAWLARAGLQDPLLGLLKLAQAAYLAGSPSLKFKVVGGQLACQFTPNSPPGNPSFAWTHREGHAWHAPLALALLTLAQEFGLAWQWNWDHQAGEGDNQGPGLRESPRATSEEGRWFRLQISKTKSWWARPWTQKARRLLQDRLAWMPMATWWNEQSLIRPLLVPEKSPPKAEALVYASPQEAGDLWLPAESQAKISQQRGLEPADRVGPAILRGWGQLRSNGKSWSETTFVVHGVSLESEPNLLDRPGITAYLTGTGLNTDLSGLQLVHDQLFRERIHFFRPEVRWLDSIRTH